MQLAPGRLRWRQEKRSKGKPRQSAKKTGQQGYAQKDRQKSQDNPKEGSEEGTASACITEESRTDREDRGQADADQ